jgi:hypothetical protein
MSTDGNESQQRLSFQHFDQEFDFGVEDENGERVRKRKRPGRKPNPPSLQERRAQNRAAQKAFRAREQCRKQEKEKQWKSYSDEIIRLKKRLAQVEYEAKYLKGSLLQLSLACLVYRGSVPNVWADTRIYQRGAAEANATAAASEPQHFTSQNGYQGGADTAYNNTNAEINQTPQLLHMILEENNHIVDFEKALAATDISRCSLKVDKRSDQGFHPLNEFINGEVQTMNKEARQPNKFFPKASSLSIRSLQKKKQNDINAAPAINTIGFEQTLQLSPLQSPQESPKEDDGALTIHQKPITGVIYEPPTLKTPDDLASMPSLQALHILRLQLKTSSILGEATPVALLPSKLAF